MKCYYSVKDRVQISGHNLHDAAINLKKYRLSLIKLDEEDDLVEVKTW